MDQIYLVLGNTWLGFLGMELTPEYNFHPFGIVKSAQMKYSWKCKVHSQNQRAGFSAFHATSGPVFRTSFVVFHRFLLFFLRWCAENSAITFWLADKFESEFENSMATISEDSSISCRGRKQLLIGNRWHGIVLLSIARVFHVGGFINSIDIGGHTMCNIQHLLMRVSPSWRGTCIRCSRIYA